MIVRCLGVSEEIKENARRLMQYRADKVNGNNWWTDHLLAVNYLIEFTKSVKDILEEDEINQYVDQVRGQPHTEILFSGR